MSRSSLPRILFFAACAALLMLPVAVIWFLASGSLNRERLLAQVPDVPVSPDLSDAMVLAAATPGALSIAVAAFVLWQMQALFRLIDNGGALSFPAASRVRRIGLGLLVLAIAGPALRPLQILLLTSANPPGERMLAIGFSSTDLALFLAAGLLTVIGASMAEAARIAEENRGFV